MTASKLVRRVSYIVLLFELDFGYNPYLPPEAQTAVLHPTDVAIVYQVPGICRFLLSILFIVPVCRSIQSYPSNK